MTVLADLHTHSTASDGQYRPAELVRMARDRGIEVLALIRWRALMRRSSPGRSWGSGFCGASS